MKYDTYTRLMCTVLAAVVAVLVEYVYEFAVIGMPWSFWALVLAAIAVALAIDETKLVIGSVVGGAVASIVIFTVLVVPAAG